MDLDETTQIIQALGNVSTLLTTALERIERGEFNHSEHARAIARKALAEGRAIAEERMPESVLERARQIEDER